MPSVCSLKSLHIDQQLVFENVPMHAFTNTLYHLGSMSPIHQRIAMTVLVSPSAWDFAGAFFWPLLATKRLAFWDICFPDLLLSCTVLGYVSHLDQSFGPQGYAISWEITIP